MRTRRHALSGLEGGKAGAHREAAANALGQGHDVGRNARGLMGKEMARAAHAALHLVEDQEQAVPVAQGPQPPQASRRNGPNATLALDRFDQDRRRFRSDHLFDRVVIGKGNLIEAVDLGSKAIEIFLLPARRQRRERPAVERAFEGEDPVAFRMAGGGVIFARHFDGAFKRFSPGIGEENGVGKTGVDQSAGKPFPVGNPVQIRSVP